MTFVRFSNSAYGLDFAWRELTAALRVEFIASFPVYPNVSH
jgi:hypothetical protein